MKRLLFLFMAISCNITACNTDDKTTPEEAGNNSVSDAKNLIVYYSWSGNSQKIATELQSILNCDIVEITPETPYTTDYNTMLTVAQSEISAIDAGGSYPAIANNMDGIGDYDAVFLCYPLWWSRMATPAQAFLHKHGNKLEGKTIALVCTSGSSGIAGTVADARRICPNSIFPEALHIRSANVANAHTLLNQWLEKVDMETNTIKLTAGNTTFTATLADNSSAKALKELLAKGDIRINMSDYGNMEKVGPFGTTLPRNDEHITTAPGDLILYQGNAFVIYYAPNTWTFTRLGKINNASRDELVAALGNGDVTVTLSLAQRESTGLEPAVTNSNEYQVSQNLAGDYITVSGEFERLTLLNTNGRIVSQTKENIIRLNKIPVGVYLLRIDADRRKTVVKKIFINSKT